MLEATFDITLRAPLAVLSVSETVNALLGYTPQDFLSSSVSLLSLIHPHDADIADRLFSIETPQDSDTLNFRLRHADGRIRCVKGIYKKTATSEGEVTLKLKLQDAKCLWKNPSRQPMMANFSALMENTDDFIFFKDRNYVFTAASQNMTSALDPILQGPTLLGLTDYDLFPEVYADTYYRLEKQVFAGMPVASAVHASQTLDGRMIWLDNHKYPIKDRSGKITGLFGISRDITKRIKAEHAIRKSEEDLREAQEIAGIGSYVLDVATELWTSSEVLDRVFGIDKDYERTVAGWANMVHPEDRATMTDYLKGEVIGKGQPFNREYRIVRQSDGSARWVSGLGALEFDAAGQTVSVRGTIQDVTERKLAELALGESRDLLESLIEHAPVSLAMFDREMRYLAVSRRGREQFDLGDRKIVGLSHYETLPWLPERFKEDHRRALAGETIRSEDDRFERPDGTARWGRSEVMPWRSGDGTIGGIILLTEDITERKMTELALRKSEESLREAQSVARIGNYELDIGTGAVTCSDAVDKLLGIDKSYEHNVAGWTALIHPDDRTMMLAHFSEEVAGKGMPLDKEYRVIRQSDGAVRWVHALGRFEFDAQGHPTLLRSTVQDITEHKMADMALHESEELLHLFIQNAPVALAMLDCEMRILALSSRWLEVYGLIGREMIGYSYYDILPEIPESWRAVHRRALAGETIQMSEGRVPLENGRVLWIKRDIRPWRTGDGAIGGIIIFTEDITEEKATRDRLNLAANVFAQASEGIVITDAHGSILEVNDAFTRITGYTREEVLAQNPRMLNSGRQSKEFYAEMWHTLIEKGSWSGEVWNRTKSGKVYAETLTINALRDHSGNTERYIGLFSDVTPIKEQEKRLKHIAHYDVLTGLPNRALLANRLNKTLTHASRTGERVAIAYVDLDNFKTVNDRHGRSIGDQVLVMVAQRMKRSLRREDTLAHLGGDEFVVVLPEVSETEGSWKVLNRLLKVASNPVELGDLTFHVSVSAGVTFFPQTEDTDADQLLRQADQAMYLAKLEGRNRYHIFDPALDRSARDHHESLERIRLALKANEFVLYYQPKVNMCTGAVLGAEALIRWLHPERGLLPPGEFLPVIEGHSIAVEIGRWVIESALIQMEQWRAEGIDVPVSVNIGADQFQQADFVDVLTSLLAAHPTIPPRMLELEVLESSAFRDMASASEAIRACKRLGVSSALDDFGTGYASLTYLKRLPVDVLKIDQTFVRDVLDDPEDMSILEGMLGLSTAFGCQTVAEGVETVEQGLMLLRLGCQVAQGYGIARPMPAKDLPAWASSWHPDPQWKDVLPFAPGNRPVLYAGVELRSLDATIEDFLNGKRHRTALLDINQCRFGIWLHGEALVDGVVLSGRGGLLGFQRIDALHQKIHALAAEVHSLNGDRRNAEATGHITELRALRDELLEKLSNLLQT